MEVAGEKFFENLKNGLDSHDKLWYPVVTARLVKPNQSSSDSLQRDACNSLWGDSVPPFHSPNFEVAFITIAYRLGGLFARILRCFSLQSIRIAAEKRLAC